MEQRTDAKLNGNNLIFAYNDAVAVKKLDYRTMEKSVTKWKPTSGVAKENYAFLSLAFEGQEIIPELANWTKTFPYDPTAARNFDINLIAGKGLQILPHNLDKEATWHRWGTETIKYLAEQTLCSHLVDCRYRTCSRLVRIAILRQNQNQRSHRRCQKNPTRSL